MGDEHTLVIEVFIPSLSGAVLEYEVFVFVLGVGEDDSLGSGIVAVVKHW